MSKSFLIMQRGSNIGSVFPLKHGHTSVGRNPDNDIMVEEVAVSRYHATFRFDEVTSEVSVMDLGSTNGVMVNNQEIKSGTPYKLQQRDTVFIGRAAFNIQIKPDYQQSVAVPPREYDPAVTQRLNLPAHYRRTTSKLG